ncbi:unnamed protein product [Brassica rapa]|uniref:Uncharacterized protein n=1 Tax=Brassica campestris TaxID=3711 RepID=A0A3P5Y6R3_BRACM|nr:unnamed protein product [Brassica rapa]VDC63039.1 unnamed protein product [Brassica rapa]
MPGSGVSVDVDDLFRSETLVKLSLGTDLDLGVPPDGLDGYVGDVRIRPFQVKVEELARLWFGIPSLKSRSKTR